MVFCGPMHKQALLALARRQLNVLWGNDPRRRTVPCATYSGRASGLTNPIGKLLTVVGV
ncbi:hypothetical protein GCM10023317_92540 [Actinopolymorpha pittospori]|uniref:Uncharacterized protein n=1 Tax=Actinopolymorpha pittospori TaxID=648752 RepID=A0A927RG91_9ACTN|nr:hypothetical protein [Actinopolymorpha pittospori]